MSHNEHVVAVVDDPAEAGATLQVARNSVEEGGSATVVLLMTPAVTRDIRDMARQQKISPVVAEQLYLDRAQETFSDAIGRKIETIVPGRLAGARSVLDVASKAHATAMAVPASLAGRRSWGRALAKAPVLVTVTPSRAA